MVSISVFPDPTDLVDDVATRIISLGSGAIAKRGHFLLMLSGGSTPSLLYECLSRPELASSLDWSKVQVFWGDERCVPPDHQDSNYRMARETLLDHVTVPPENIHRIQGEHIPQAGASQYDAEVRGFFQSKVSRIDTANTSNEFLPRFDLILLGMGTDGHTASLFPGSSALMEKEKWFMAVEHDMPPPPLVPRITVTPSVINAGTYVFFLVTGKDKARRLSQVLEGPYRPDELPAQMIRPENGEISWYLDQAAASRLGNLGR